MLLISLIVIYQQAHKRLTVNELNVPRGTYIFEYQINNIYIRVGK